MTDAPSTRIVSLRVSGMGCAACVEAVQAALASVPGVVRAWSSSRAVRPRSRRAAPSRPRISWPPSSAGYEANPAWATPP